MHWPLMTLLPSILSRGCASYGSLEKYTHTRPHVRAQTWGADYSPANADESSDSESSSSSSSSSGAKPSHAAAAISDGASLLDLLGDQQEPQAGTCDNSSLLDLLGAGDAGENVAQPKTPAEDNVQPWTPRGKQILSPPRVKLATPMHRDTGPKRSCLAKARAGAHGNGAKRWKGDAFEANSASNARLEVTFTAGACLAKFALVRNHRQADLWYRNPGQEVVCNWCQVVMPQAGGRLQGAEGRSQFAQTKFVCISCIEVTDAQEAAGETWADSEAYNQHRESWGPRRKRRARGSDAETWPPGAGAGVEGHESWAAGEGAGEEGDGTWVAGDGTCEEVDETWAAGDDAGEEVDETWATGEEAGQEVDETWAPGDGTGEEVDDTWAAGGGAGDGDETWAAVDGTGEEVGETWAASGGAAVEADASWTASGGEGWDGAEDQVQWAHQEQTLAGWAW